VLSVAEGEFAGADEVPEGAFEFVLGVGAGAGLVNIDRGVATTD